MQCNQQNRAIATDSANREDASENRGERQELTNRSSSRALAREESRHFGPRSGTVGTAGHTGDIAELALAPHSKSHNLGLTLTP